MFAEWVALTRKILGEVPSLPGAWVCGSVARQIDLWANVEPN